LCVGVGGVWGFVLLCWVVGGCGWGGGGGGGGGGGYPDPVRVGISLSLSKPALQNVCKTTSPVTWPGNPFGLLVASKHE